MRNEKRTTLVWHATPWGLHPIALYMTVWTLGNFSHRSAEDIPLVLLGALVSSRAGSNSSSPRLSNFSYRYSEYVLMKADMSSASGVLPSL